MHLICCFLLFVIFGVHGRSELKCQQEKNCKLPNCFCPTFNHPLMNISNIPQMIYFGFDDALTPLVDPFYRKLFRSNRINPNGCPIGMTLFVSDQYTSYSEAKYFYDKGMEIASHSVTHDSISTRNALNYEARQQKANLVEKAGIPNSDIVGWRSPNLKTAGDYQPDVLQKLGYQYDVSMTYSRLQMWERNPWPFTADFGWPYRCQQNACLSKPHPGFWEFPINSMIDYKGAYPCGYVDGCINNPTNEEEAFQFLMDNFNNNYQGNRAPFGLHMHAAWFLKSNFNDKAMDRFIKEVLKRPDVYIITVKQVLDWMKSPTGLSQIEHFRPWKCKQSYLKPTTTQTTTESTSKATTKPTTTYKTTASTTQTTIKTTTVSPTTESTTKTTKPTTVSPTRTSTQPTTYKTHEATSKTSKITAKASTKYSPIELQSNISNKASTTTKFALSVNIQPTKSAGKAITIPTSPVKIPSTAVSSFRFNEQSTTTFNPVTSSASTNKFDLSWLWHGLFTKPKVTPLHSVKSYLQNTEGKCMQGINCKLPKCFCQSDKSPGGLMKRDTPQFVYISFDGDLNSRASFKYKKLFSGKRKNPNNCPISSTFFVSKFGSMNENMYSYLNNKGQEIAMRSSSSHAHRNPEVDQVMSTHRSDMSAMGIPVNGWRSSGLKPNGDIQFSTLSQQGMKYDSTLVLQNIHAGKQWPFTLDFGWKDQCVIPECPKKTYPGLWEIPNVPVTDYRNMYPCNYVDGCMFSPITADETFQFLWTNFKSFYKTNKAPFGINLRHIWFTHQAYRNNLKGFEMLLDRLGQIEDVYIVSNEKLIKWMENPIPLFELKMKCL